MSTMTLEPCPFCGGEAELTSQPCELPGFNGQSWSASCRGDLDADCFASTFAQFKTREYAIEAWNKRTHHAELEAVVRDARRWRYVVKHAEWIRDEDDTLMAIRFAGVQTNLESVGMRTDAIDQAVHNSAREE